MLPSVSRGLVGFRVALASRRSGHLLFFHSMHSCTLPCTYRYTCSFSTAAPGGITIKTIKPGDGGSSPQRGQTVSVHYVGKLAGTATVFDSSRTRGRPFSFQVGIGQVISGEIENVQCVWLSVLPRYYIVWLSRQVGTRPFHR